MPCKWSSREILILKIFRKRKKTIKQIAHKLRRSEYSVVMKIRRLNRKGELKIRRFIFDDSFSFDYIQKELLMKGLLIWFCEGTRQSENNSSVEVVNSDPRIISLFIKFLRELRINEEKLRLKLKIPIKDELKAKKFWSELLHINMSSFNQSLVPSGNRKSNYLNGTLTIKYSSKKLLEEFNERAEKILFGKV